jgi:hypothetical protein
VCARRIVGWLPVLVDEGLYGPFLDQTRTVEVVDYSLMIFQLSVALDSEETRIEKVGVEDY